MKKIMMLTFFITLIIPLSLFAEEKTLLSKGLESGGYGGPVIKIKSVAGDAGVLAGGRGGWIINHTFVIGGGRYRLRSDLKVDGNDLNLRYGGLEFEYIGLSDEVLHFTVHTGLGRGWVSYENTDFSHRFFYIEPTVNGEINIVGWFRINAGVGYLWVDGIQDMPGLSTGDIRGLTGTLVFKFGWF